MYKHDAAVICTVNVSPTTDNYRPESDRDPNVRPAERPVAKPFADSRNAGENG